jgi:two-component system nitrogen regulation response regulator NtrX
MWALRLLDGPLAGSSWPLSDGTLIVGRGLGCHVRLDDPRVSRNHCGLVVDTEGPRAINMSERNPTLINGVPRDDIRLQAGDVIEVASFRMMIAPAAGNICQQPDSNTTLAMSDAVHSRDDFDAAAYNTSPALTEDLHALFRTLRTMSRADSLDGLVACLRAHLISHFSAQECWVGWCAELESNIALFPPASPGETRRAPMELMRECCRLGQGIMPPVYAPEGRAMLAAPLVHGPSAFGAIVVCQDFSVGAFTKRQLNYLVSIAECAAPLVRATERLDQLKRDEAARFPAAQPHARMLGASQQMDALRTSLRRTALARGNVLIVGETGVGKELAARMLHDLSARSQGPYVPVNCAAIPAELFESEVFGYERGAFSGATRARKGLFESAHGGTLFLDEVGDLSLPNQARLLRAVELGAFRRLGAEEELHVDVRVISATNRPLPDGSGAYFRTDLYHRLASIEVVVPPLRARAADIPELAQHFLNEFGRHAPARPRSMSREAIEVLTRHPWPGNIRELRNVIERACYVASSDVITATDLILTPVRDAASLASASSPALIPRSDPEAAPLDAAERRHIVSTLEQCHWNVAETAATLGVSKSTMYYKLSRHRIDVKRRKA